MARASVRVKFELLCCAAYEIRHGKLSGDGRMHPPRHANSASQCRTSWSHSPCPNCRCNCSGGCRMPCRAFLRSVHQTGPYCDFWNLAVCVGSTHGSDVRRQWRTGAFNSRLCADAPVLQPSWWCSGRDCRCQAA